jgi:pimeloyl-ACP methyl ester carboxylesterase
MSIPATVRRSLSAAAPVAVAAALSLGLLPAGSSAAETSVDTAPTFTPTLTYVECPAAKKPKLPARTECAELTVPLDWQSPDDGRTVDLAIRVTPASGNPGRNGLTWNPGGPGIQAINDHGAFYSLLPASVRQRFDFVSWDPRGVGLSGPKLAGCKAARNVHPPATGPVDWDAYWLEVESIGGAAAAACFAANPNAAPYVGTWQVVRDLDALREALGYARWNFWGMSYGTVVGNAYARTFPARLRTLIEDGSRMANETLSRFGATTPQGVYTAIQVYASLVGKEQAYKIKAVERFLDDSVMYIGTKTYDRWQAHNELVEDLRVQGNYASVKSLVNASYDYVKAVDSGGIQRAQRAMSRAQERNTRKSPPSDAFLRSFVTCADLSDRPTPSDLAAMSRQAERNYGTSYGIDVGRASDCLGLPAGFSSTPDNGDQTVRLTTPPLFLLTEGDMATPWIWGRSLANTYTGSRTMTYASTEHVSFFRTASTCMKKAAERYLLYRALPATDTFCPYVPIKPKAS